MDNPETQTTLGTREHTKQTNKQTKIFKKRQKKTKVKRCAARTPPDTRDG